MDPPTLIDTISGYFHRRSEVVAVYLYGSYAGNRPRRTSDVDIGVLLSPDGQDIEREKRLQYMLELSRILRKDMHVVVMNSAGEELVKQIFSKGKCILVNDRESFSRYRTYAYIRIAEFAYYRDLLQKAFIRKLTGDRFNG
jgi:predicted nucleotidyltransferase